MQLKGYYKVRYKGNYGDLLWIGPLDDSDPGKIKELAKEAIGIKFNVDILDIIPFEKSHVRVMTDINADEVKEAFLKAHPSKGAVIVNAKSTDGEWQ